MNSLQLKKYWPEWKKAEAKLIERGLDKTETEAMRKRIHVKRGAFYVVNGVFKVKSSNRLTNREFDAVLADFLAISHGDDLDTQLEQLNMPAKRMLYATAELLEQIGIAEHGREKYLEGVARKPLDDCDDNDVQRCVIALNHTAQHKAKTNHNHPRSGKGRERYDHRVGERSRSSQADQVETKNPIRNDEEILEDAPF